MLIGRSASMNRVRVSRSSAMTMKVSPQALSTRVFDTVNLNRSTSVSAACAFASAFTRCCAAASAFSAVAAAAVFIAVASVLCFDATAFTAKAACTATVAAVSLSIAAVCFSPASLSAALALL